MSNKAQNNAKVEATVEASANNKMAAMLAAAQQNEQAAAEQPQAAKPAKKGLKVTSSKDENGNNRRKRNEEYGDRAVAIFVSPSLNKCWIGTHLGFAHKDEAGCMKIMQNAPQKALEPLQTATDVELSFFENNKNIALGEALDNAKATAWDQMQAKGYEMLSRKGKGVSSFTAPATEADADTEEAITDETEEQAES